MTDCPSCAEGRQRRDDYALALRDEEQRSAQDRRTYQVRITQLEKAICAAYDHIVNEAQDKAGYKNRADILIMLDKVLRP